MGFRFNKRLRIAPGISLNLSGKRGASLSVGPKGAKINVGLDGRRRTTISAPGTGLSHVSESGPAPRRRQPSRAPEAAEVQALQAGNESAPPKKPASAALGGTGTWLLWTAITQVIALGVIGPVFGDAAGGAAAGFGALMAVGLGVRAAIKRP